MPMCSVYGCKEMGGHKFPKDEELKQKWLVTIRREKTFRITSASRVCSSHFRRSDYATEGFDTGQSLTRRVLLKGAVPSVFSWKRNLLTSSRTSRSSELKKKNLRVFEGLKKNKARSVHEKIPDLVGDVASPNDTTNCHEFIEDATLEIEIGAEETVFNKPVDDKINRILSTGNCPNKNRSVKKLQNKRSTVSVSTVSVSTQTTANLFSCFQYERNPRGISYYTGLESFEKFLFVFATLGPAVHELQYRYNDVSNLRVEDQFFMTLVKLRTAMPDTGISLLFDISEKSVANVIITWINFMALEWRELNVWPSKQLIEYYMPEGFRNVYPSTRVILDGTEIPIAKPTNPVFQQATFSTYKNRNTLKVVVGASPGGLISYCSPAYAGSVSDRAVIERSALLQNCSQGDSVMADRGFTVQDIFATKGVTVNIPAFMRGKSQLSGLTVVKDRKLASKRVHIERVIGLSKTYKIMKAELNAYYVHLGTEITSVCFMLCNFREGIVSKKA